MATRTGERRLQILQTLAAMLENPKSEKVTTAALAAKLTVSEAALYRHFAIDLDKSQRAKFNRKWDGIWTEDLVNYALSDVVHLPRLMQEQSDWLSRLDLAEEYAFQLSRSIVRQD